MVLFHAYQHNRTGPDSAWPWSGGAHQAMLGTELFVEMFFVLSGFVLWLPIARTALEGRVGRPGWVMLFRRMARLTPLYFAVVLVVWALTNPSLPGHWQDLLLHLTFTHIYSDEYIFWTNGPAWSLAVEFHFYVLMALSVPLIHAGVRRAATRRARMAIVLVLPALLLVSGITYLTWITVWSPVEMDNWSALFSPLSRAADFGVGTALAVITAAGVRLGRRARIGTAIAGAGRAGLPRRDALARPGRRVVAPGVRGRHRRGADLDRAARRAVAEGARAALAGLGGRPRLRDLPDPRAGDAAARPPGTAPGRTAGILLPGHRA